MYMDICFVGSVDSRMCICVHVFRYCNQVLYWEAVGTAIFIRACRMVQILKFDRATFFDSHLKIIVTCTPRRVFSHMLVEGSHAFVMPSVRHLECCALFNK